MIITKSFHRVVFLLIIILLLNFNCFILNIFNNVDPNTKNIHLGSCSDPLTGLTVTWEGAAENDSIRWGYTEKFEKGTFPGVRRDGYNNFLFDYVFKNMKPQATIYYCIWNSALDEWTDIYTFSTASDTGTTTFSFSVGGDSRTDLKTWRKVAHCIDSADFSLYCGDIVNEGTNVDDWDNWFKYGEKFIADNVIYHTYGNHDRGPIYTNLFVLPGNEKYYSFIYGNALFVCLDSERPDDAVQLEWLRNLLTKNNDVQWKFVWFHKPFYTQGSHEGEMDTYFDTWWKMFDDFGIDMIFCGHSHNYLRTKPINRNISTTKPVQEYGSKPGQGICQIVTGGYGAPLKHPGDCKWFCAKAAMRYHYCMVTITGKKLIFQAKDMYNNIFDEVVIEKE